MNMRERLIACLCAVVGAGAAVGMLGRGSAAAGPPAGGPVATPAPPQIGAPTVSVGGPQ